jgi:spermidine synthase
MRSTDKFIKHLKRQNPFREALSWFKADDVIKGQPYIEEEDGVLTLHFDEMSVQSEMRLDAPDELVMSYTRALMSFMLFVPNPEQIAMVGLGGGSLAKYCYRNLPQSDILVLEINPAVIALRQEFAIPPDNERFHVMLADGADYIGNAPVPVDVLIVDGFDAKGHSPQLGSQQFYDNCFAMLKENGILALNLWFEYASYKEYLSRICHSFADRVVIIDVEGGSANKIILAVKSADFPPSAATLRQHAESLSRTHLINYPGKAEQIIRTLAASEA